MCAVSTRLTEASAALASQQRLGRSLPQGVRELPAGRTAVEPGSAVDAPQYGVPPDGCSSRPFVDVLAPLVAAHAIFTHNTVREQLWRAVGWWCAHPPTLRAAPRLRRAPVGGREPRTPRAALTRCGRHLQAGRRPHRGSHSLVHAHLPALVREAAGAGAGGDNASSAGGAAELEARRLAEVAAPSEGRAHCFEGRVGQPAVLLSHYDTQHAYVCVVQSEEETEQAETAADRCPCCVDMSAAEHADALGAAAWDGVAVSAKYNQKEVQESIANCYGWWNEERRR